MSLSTPTDFLLVIPAFKEAHRLPPFLEALKRSLSSAAYPTKILVVDDGSPAVEQAELTARIQPDVLGNCTVAAPLLLPDNRHKGGAILAGWRQGTAARWLAFVDADGAISAAEVRRVFDLAFAENRAGTAYFAVRQRGRDHPVERSLLRHVASRLFSWLAGCIVRERVRDSQCGFKIIPAGAFKHIDSWLTGCGFCFDIELLVALRDRGVGVNVQEVPVAWTEQPGGKFHILRHTPEMIRQLVRLRRRAHDGIMPCRE